MGCYNLLCENVILPIADLASGRSIAKKLKFLESTQWWPQAKLAQFQDQQLRKVIRHAYDNTRYFKTMMDARAIAPESIRTTADLEDFPVCNKALIREHGIDSFVAGEKRRLIKETTSGSTGKQGTFYLSRESQSLTCAAQLLFLKWGGFRLGHRHLQTGMTLDRGFEKRAKDLVFRCNYVSAFNLRDRDLDEICQLVGRRRIKTLVGYASSLFCLASHVDMKKAHIKLDSVLSLGDMLYPHYRRVIETAFRCKVHDTYGCTEGFQIAGQCVEMQYHNCMPLNYLEILNEKGKRLPPGESGRVVLTRLDMNPMPLIRYDVGDVAALSMADSCRCGRNWRLLDSIQGRDTDIVVTSNGHRLIVHFFTAIFEHEPRIKQFQVVQDTKEEICILVVPDDTFTSDVLVDIKKKILERCGHDLMVTFRVVDNIPPAKSGKRRFVISKVFRDRGTK